MVARLEVEWPDEEKRSSGKTERDTAMSTNRRLLWGIEKEDCENRGGGLCAWPQATSHEPREGQSGCQHPPVNARGWFGFFSNAGELLSLGSGDAGVSHSWVSETNKIKSNLKTPLLHFGFYPPRSPLFQRIWRMQTTWYNQVFGPEPYEEVGALSLDSPVRTG